MRLRVRPEIVFTMRLTKINVDPNNMLIDTWIMGIVYGFMIPWARDRYGIAVREWKRLNRVESWYGMSILFSKAKPRNFKCVVLLSQLELSQPADPIRGFFKKIS